MIDANVLMSAAKERTGLTDWGDDWYLEPMHWLVDAINKESELTEFGAGNLAVADLTTGAVPGQAGYGVPDGVLSGDDFFFYLDLYAAGC